MITTVSAPVFAAPNDSQPPLRVAKEGSVLLLVDASGGWYYIEFDDPQFGRRVGYVQQRYARLGTPQPSQTQPTDLSVREAPMGHHVAPLDQKLDVQIVDRQTSDTSSKYALKGDYINRRSCRMPLVNDIEAEFDGDKAKLKWSVSIDGKKMESDTYNILAVLDRR